MKPSNRLTQHHSHELEASTSTRTDGQKAHSTPSMQPKQRRVERADHPTLTSPQSASKQPDNKVKIPPAEHTQNEGGVGREEVSKAKKKREKEKARLQRQKETRQHAKLGPYDVKFPAPPTTIASTVSVAKRTAQDPPQAHAQKSSAATSTLQKQPTGHAQQAKPSSKNAPINAPINTPMTASTTPATAKPTITAKTGPTVPLAPRTATSRKDTTPAHKQHKQNCQCEREGESLVHRAQNSQGVAHDFPVAPTPVSYASIYESAATSTRDLAFTIYNLPLHLRSPLMPQRVRLQDPLMVVTNHPGASEPTMRIFLAHVLSVVAVWGADPKILTAKAREANVGWHMKKKGWRVEVTEVSVVIGGGAIRETKALRWEGKKGFGARALERGGCRAQACVGKRWGPGDEAEEKDAKVEDGKGAESGELKEWREWTEEELDEMISQLAARRLSKHGE